MGNNINGVYMGYESGDHHDHRYLLGEARACEREEGRDRAEGATHHRFPKSQIATRIG